MGSIQALPFAVEPIKRRAELAKAHFPEDTAEVIARANSAVARQLILPTACKVDLHHGVWPTPSGDAEHRFALHRWSFGLDLAKAWALEENHDYAITFRHLLESWEEQVFSQPPHAGNPIWEPYSTAERIVHWCWSIPLLCSSDDFQELTRPRLERLLAIHAFWLSEHLEIFDINNHILNNARALVTFGIVFAHRESEELGWRLLIEHLPQQVDAEGFLREQSVHYQLLLTRTLGEMVLLCQHHHRVLPKPLDDLVPAMIRTACWLIRPDGSLPIIGDFSPDVGIRPLIGTIAAAARTLNLAEADHLPLGEQGIWLMANPDATLHLAPYPAGGKWLSQAGFAVVAGENSHLVVHADMTTHRHGHADLTSLTLWKNGLEIIVDPGCFSFAPEKVHHYRHGAAHNAPLLDDHPPQPLFTGQASLVAPDYRQTRLRISPPEYQHDLWQMTIAHDGFLRFYGGGEAIRQVKLTPDHLYVRDQLRFDGQHRVSITWQFGAELECTHDPQGFRLEAKGVMIAHLSFLANGTPLLAQLIPPGNADSLAGWISPAYGQRIPAPAIRVTTSAQETLCVEMFLRWQSDGTKM